MDINIIVAKRDREEDYDIFLHYLNKISVGHDVTVYVTSSKDTLKYPPEYFQFLENIFVNHQHAPAPSFNKSILLNQGLARMRSHYDVVCIMDIDMVYNQGFFTKVESLIKRGHNYIVCSGQNLSEEQTFQVFEKIPEEVHDVGVQFTGCSQICLTEDALDTLEDLFGFVYDDKFEGWGGEDSDLSYKSSVLHNHALLSKTVLKDVWNHLEHPSRKPVDVENTDNYKRYIENKPIIEKQVTAYRAERSKM
jgi:hypothetical protein